MATKNPLSMAQRASLSIGPDTKPSTRPRPRLQANPAMAARLRWWLRILPFTVEARHG